MKRSSISHEFIELMPKTLEEGVLYISTPYETAIHLCACGCGIKVVTPISPPEWQLIWDGDTVSLYPSIGNWRFPCRSHYWIRRNRIQWAETWSEEEANRARQMDALDMDAYFTDRATEPAEPVQEEEKQLSLLQRAITLLRGR